MEKNRYKIYKKSPVSTTVALLLIISVDRCYPLRTRYPTRAAQGPRPYKMSPYALYNSIEIGIFKASQFCGQPDHLIP